MVKEMVVALANFMSSENFVKLPDNPKTGVKLALIICQKIPFALTIFRDGKEMASNIEALLKFSLLDGLLKFENRFASVFSITK